MYGEWVRLDLGNEIDCKVFVMCTPDTTDEELQKRAFAQLAKALYKGR